MDTATLVDTHIDEGHRLLAALARSGFDVAAAFWVSQRETEEEPRLVLYVVSEMVDRQGLMTAYRALHDAISKMADPWLSVSQVRLIGLTNPAAQDVLRLVREHREKLPAHIPGGLAAEPNLEEIYVYAPLVAMPRLQGPGIEERKLKVSVERKSQPYDLFEPLSVPEKKAIEQMVASGVSREQAKYWIQKRREAERPVPEIPAGTVVKTRVTAFWGDKPEDDHNPLLLVEAPDGTQGLTFKQNTEPV